MKARFFMSTQKWDIQKIGIWFLLLAFVFVAFVLPAANPSAVLTDTFTLIVGLIIISAFSLAAPQRVCTGCHFEILPRGPPIF